MSGMEPGSPKRCLWYFIVALFAGIVFGYYESRSIVFGIVVGVVIGIIVALIAKAKII